MEVIFYTALFAIVIVGMFNMAVFLTERSQLVIEKNQLVTESSLLFDEVARLIKTGKTVNDANSTLDQDLSVFEFDDADANTIKLEVVTGVLKKTFNGGTALNLHSDDISVDRFYVRKLNQANNVGLINVSMEFSNSFGQEFALTTTLNFVYE